MILILPCEKKLESLTSAYGELTNDLPTNAAVAIYDRKTMHYNNFLPKKVREIKVRLGSQR